MNSTFFIIIFFATIILKSVALKICADRLNHVTAPIYISTYVMIGLLCTLPFYNDLFIDGFLALETNPLLAVLITVKGFVFWYLIHQGQALTKHSLSSANYILPPAVSLAAIANARLGENLTTIEWVSVLGLSLIGVAFFFKGHLRDLNKQARFIYLKLVISVTCLIIIDHYVVLNSNWFVLLFFSNAVVFVGCIVKTNDLNVWKTALFNKMGMVAGVSFAVFELVKFPAMVTILPVSVIAIIEVSTIPIMLILASVIWKERGVKEQMSWGIISAALLIVLILGS